MDLDLLLAITHHLAVFSLVAIFAAEFALLRPGLSGARLGQLARIDAAYGIMAVLVLLAGIGRVIFAAKGWDYYASNHAFWGKMGAILVVGLLSVPPTLSIRRWVKSGGGAETYAPPPNELSASRRFVHLQALGFLFIPIFAAAMARGYGS